MDTYSSMYILYILISLLFKNISLKCEHGSDGISTWSNPSLYPLLFLALLNFVDTAMGYRTLVHRNRDPCIPLQIHLCL